MIGILVAYTPIVHHDINVHDTRGLTNCTFAVANSLLSNG